MLNYSEALEQITKKSYPSICLFYGKEEYFITNLKNHVIDSVRSNTKVDIIHFDLKETAIQEVVSEAETYPFFSDKKIIIANHAVFLKTKQEKLPFEHDIKAFHQYIENPTEFTVLILIAPYEKIDERKKISKLLKSKAMVAQCNPIPESNLHNWIQKIAHQHQVKLDKGAIEVMEREVSTDLSLLHKEMEKISLYAENKEMVTKEITEALISSTENSSVHRLVDVIMEQDLEKAIRIYKELEKMNEEVIGMIGLIAYQFRMIFQVKILKEKGYTSYQIQKQLKAHPYTVKLALKREKYFTHSKLKQIIYTLTETDAKLKQGKLEKNLAFELLLYEIISQKQVKNTETAKTIRPV